MKAILKKMDLIVNLKGFALVLLGVGMLVSSQGAWGQNTSGPASDIMESLIPKRSNSTDKLTSLLDAPITLPGGAPAPAAESNENKGAEEARQADNAGRNDQTTKTVVLPALKGFRQLADAEPIQKMYKELINTKVPVLVQTMMMVENGAATGFIGSMNMVSNLMNNTVQSQQLQMQLMDLTDETGQMRKAYAEKIAKTLQEQGEKKEESWPVALYAASDDDLDTKVDPITKITKPTPLALTGSPSVAEDKKDKKEIEFVKDILITKVALSTGPAGPSLGTSGASSIGPELYKNEKIQEQQEEFVELVGDFKITVDQKGKLVKQNIIKHIKAKEEKGERGITRLSRKEITKVWENINNLMNKKCEYNKQNDNLNKEPKEKILSTVGIKWEYEEWRDASAPDLQITENLLDQIYSLSREKISKEKGDCGKSFPKGSGFKPPFAGDYAEADEKSPDDCKATGGKPTPCLRFKAIFRMASLIGTSRAYHTYQVLDNISSRYVNFEDHETEKMRRDLFKHVLGDSQISTYIDINHDKWNELTLYLARSIQAERGSGANFRPGLNNAIAAGNGMGGFGEKSQGQ